jgi:hypothetical protein
MFVARSDELLLALHALVASAGAKGLGTRSCADMMEHATTAARIAPLPVLKSIGADDPTLARLGAVRVLTSLCADCGACPRGTG